MISDPAVPNSTAVNSLFLCHFFSPSEDSKKFKVFHMNGDGLHTCVPAPVKSIKTSQQVFIGFKPPPPAGFYVNNIHRARVNIGWCLASAIWLEVRNGWPSLHICRAAGEANIDEVNRAHRGPYHELNISRYSRTRGEYCTYTWKVRNESFLSTSVLCERLKLQCLYSGPLRPNWLDRTFSSCIRQLADCSGGKSEDSWASGPVQVRSAAKSL